MGSALKLVLVCSFLVFTLLQTPVHQFSASHVGDEEIIVSDSLPTEEVFEQAQKLNRGQFYENKGQIPDDEVMFYGNIPGGMIGFGESKVFLWMGDTQDCVVLFFEGAKPVIPQGTDELWHRTNYFLGDRGAYTNVRGFSSVKYKELWPGISLLYSATEMGAKYEFQVSPGANPSTIVIQCGGQDFIEITQGSVKLQKNGNMLVDDGLEVIQEGARIASEIQ